MSYQIEGTLHAVFPVQQLAPTFRRREFVLETQQTNGDRTYTDYIKMQMTQERCPVLDRYQLGQPVKVSFNIKGRKVERNGQWVYYTTLDAWLVTTADGSEPQGGSSFAGHDRGAQGGGGDRGGDRGGYRGGDRNSGGAGGGGGYNRDFSGGGGAPAPEGGGGAPRGEGGNFRKRVNSAPKDYDSKKKTYDDDEDWGDDD